MVDITLSGPGKNALGTEMMEWLRARLRDAAGRPVLLSGAGDCFSAGLDLKEVVALDETAMETFLERLDALVRELFLYPGPVVALVNGHAIAGGSVLLLCCDHRVAKADPRIRIGLSEVALGVRFSPVVLRLAQHRLPKRTMETVLLGAGLHDPQSACALGLVDEVSDDAPAVARARLDALARHPADAYANAKARLRRGVMDVPDAERREFMAGDLRTWTSAAVKQRLGSVLKR